MRPGDVLGPLQLEAIREVVRQELAELATAPRVEGYISTAEAAQRAGVAGDTIRSWIARGVLEGTRPPGTKGWRIRPADLQAVLAGGESTPLPPVRLEERRQNLARRLAEGVDGGGGEGGRSA